MPGLEIGHGGADHVRRVGPDADDAAGHVGGAGGVEELGEAGREPGVESARRPQRGVTEILHGRGGVELGLIRHGPAAAPPGAHSAETNALIGAVMHGCTVPEQGRADPGLAVPKRGAHPR